jgi:hypothetical protein
MGIFYKTILIKDFSGSNLNEILKDENKYIVLATINQIIDMHEKQTGRVLRSDLLKYFSDKIKDDDIGEKSRIVECMITTYDKNDTPEMTLNLEII